MQQKAEQQEFKQCGVDLEGPTAQTVQMLEEVLLLPLLMTPCCQRVECAPVLSLIAETGQAAACGES